jgi:hypothetical protein
VRTSPTYFLLPRSRDWTTYGRIGHSTPFLLIDLSRLTLRCQGYYFSKTSGIAPALPLCARASMQAMTVAATPSRGTLVQIPNTRLGERGTVIRRARQEGSLRGLGCLALLGQTILGSGTDLSCSGDRHSSTRIIALAIHPQRSVSKRYDGHLETDARVMGAAY